VNGAFAEYVSVSEDALAVKAAKHHVWKLSLRLSLRHAKTALPEPTPAKSPIGEAKETEGFTRKIDDVREADFRLANRRLQPLGHLTLLIVGR
jgi:hypothetical protein